MIEPGHPSLSIRAQCELVGLPRSSFYYRPVGESEDNLRIMHLLDEIYTDRPFYGSRKMRVELGRRGVYVNRKRIGRLMRLMGLEAVYPKPGTSQPHPEHRVYPYLLGNRIITRPNEVWAADITYLRMDRGFMYLTAIIDWFSRYVLSWALSNTMDTVFCVRALERALEHHGTPDIFNTDQGSTFTSIAFTDRLKAKQVQISMDGRGRVHDNIFVERLWRSLKYEDVYLRDYRSPPELEDGIGRYFRFFNDERPHQSLEYRTPTEVYAGGQSLI